MATVDVSGISYFLPIISFLVIFLVSFAVMMKAKLPESKFLQVLISFLIATIFISIGGARTYIENVAPWFAVVLVSLFLMFLVLGLAGKGLDDWAGGIGKIFVVVLFVVFVISALFVFSSSISPYLPWTQGYQSTTTSSYFTDWLYSPRTGGAVLLLIVSAVVAWILIKAK